nr:hypothetical protein RKHAN_02526 [Rhizobium sp. Khangiran2]
MKEIGKIRRSQVISTYGPGSIIDFRSPAGAPISAISGGLEDWDSESIKKGLMSDQVIREPRLQKRLEVEGFRTPPVGQESTGKRDAKGKMIMRDRQIPASRFPNWHFCPSCNLLQHTDFWRSDMGKPELYCGECSGRPGRPRQQFVVPVRFVVACENGHLGEFPWQKWCEHRDGCDRRKPLKLLTEGAGLSGLFVLCTGCGGKKSLGTAFSDGALQRIGHNCSGRSPWLPKPAEVCDKAPAVIQRGASNAYFPIVESSIDIPPWGDTFQEALGSYWRRLTKMIDRNPSAIRTLVEEEIIEDWSGPPMSVDDMVARIELRLKLLEGVNTDNLRVEEYAHLTSGEMAEAGEAEPNFQIRAEMIPERWNYYIQHLVRVERLREVRALRGFTRLTPLEGDQQDRKMAPLSVERRNWLPAIEVFGEGIFVALEPSKLSEWENSKPVEARAERLKNAAEREWKERNGDAVPFPLEITPRFLLIHTLAHAFIRRLSLDCGYSSSSLRERLYVSAGDQPMAGFLVYTSAPDADGTLGGLSREGRSSRLDITLFKAIRDLEWCSSDPLCSSEISSFADNHNLAACHSCSFLPETSCEHFNRYLDRGLVAGLPGQPELGFFCSVVAGGE